MSFVLGGWWLVAPLVVMWAVAIPMDEIVGDNWAKLDEKHPTFLRAILYLQLPTLDNPAQRNLLLIGIGVCVAGMAFGMLMFTQVRSMPAHKAMLDVSHTIYETCKAYLLKQGQLLMVLELFIGACIVYYFGFLQHMGAMRVITILAFSVLGILGSYSVAWFGIRMNTFANSRTAFASLPGKPRPVH